MKNLLYIFILMAGGLCGQTITPQVINSAGDHREVQGTGVWITDNVGEPFTETMGPQNNMMITQGFIQPEADGVIVLFNGLTCIDKDDGMISVSRSSSALSPVVSETFNWYPATACPAGNCGNKLTNLRPGTYTVEIITTYANNKTDTLRRTATITNATEPCRIKIFSGVTPNGDGNNDIWTIENISEFPNNHVSIYSRWGNLLYDTKGYDNETRYWPNQDMVNRLIASTYFYIVDLGDGSKPIKGWVELIKN